MALSAELAGDLKKSIAQSCLSTRWRKVFSRCPLLDDAFVTSPNVHSIRSRTLYYETEQGSSAMMLNKSYLGTV